MNCDWKGYFQKPLLKESSQCFIAQELHAAAADIAVCVMIRSMFTSEMSECHTRTVTIYDVDESAFVSLIEFAYTARITLTTDNVQTLLYACSILQVFNTVSLSLSVCLSICLQVTPRPIISVLAW